MSALKDDGRRFFDPRIETAGYRELEAIQLKSVKRIVAYAYDNCPFYHKRWRQAGVHVGDIETLGDFCRRIPTFTKDDLRRESTGFDITGGITSCPPGDLRSYAMTSGTTGINTFIGLGSGFLETFLEQVAFREYWIAQLRPGMKAFMVPAGWHFFGIAQNMVLTEMGVTCVSSWGTLFHRFIPGIIDALKTHRPDYFLGLPWVVAELIKQSAEAGIEPKKLFSGVKYMSLAGEFITPGFRKKIVDETGVLDVFESGGSVDGLWGGTDCFAHEGHHIWMDQIFSEVVGLDGRGEVGDGERGRIVTTNLRLGGPLYIRFLGEDLVRKTRARCRCGRTHERVELYDRLVNSFRAAGKMITSHDVSSVIEDVCGYTVFAVVNPERVGDRLRVRIDKQKASAKRASVEARLDRLSRRRLGVGMEVEWVDLSKIPFVNRKFVQIAKDEGAP